MSRGQNLIFEVALLVLPINKWLLLAPSEFQSKGKGLDFEYYLTWILPYLIFQEPVQYCDFTVGYLLLDLSIFDFPRISNSKLLLFCRKPIHKP